jgi:hypothetical protein
MTSSKDPYTTLCVRVKIKTNTSIVYVLYVCGIRIVVG